MTTDAEAPRLLIRDPRVMRALAHPARFAIMDYLMTGAEGTATECAEVCGLSPSATSYHLRALARAGLVEEAPGRGDGRERVWRSSVRGFDMKTDESDDPEVYAAGRDFIEVFLDRENAALQEWLRRSPEQPQRWRDVALIAGVRMIVTADELAGITKAIRELVEPFEARHRQASPPDGSRRVSMGLRAFPID